MTRHPALAGELKFLQNAIGAVPAPLDCFLVLRGIKTLALRVERHASSAGKIARWLELHPKVEQVHYPGLKSHPQHRLARRQMSGFGGVVSFDLGTRARVGAVCRADCTPLLPAHQSRTRRYCSPRYQCSPR